MTLVVSLQSTVPAWMEDLHADVDAKTGYLVSHPKGLYGQKIKELVRYFSGQSVELKAIRHGRRVRPSACCLYTGILFQFLSEYVFPIAFALFASYMYYQWTPTEIPLPPLVPSGPLLQNETAQDGGWFDWMPSAAEAGSWLGSTTRSLASVPVSFLTHAVDRSLHVQEAFASIQSTGSKIFLLPLLFVAVYFLTKIVCRVLLHIQTLCSAQRRIWHLQEILIQDTEEALERALTGMIRPFLLNYYETILTLPSSSSSSLVPADKANLLRLTQTYRGHLPLMRVNLYDRLAMEVKQFSFAELVKRGGLSPSYQRALHQLIRYADDELSNILFSFHEEIHRVPEAIQSKVLDAGHFAIQGVTRAASTAMVLASAL